MAQLLSESFLMRGISFYAHVTKGSVVSEGIRHRVAGDFAGAGIPANMVRRLRHYAFGAFFDHYFGDIPDLRVRCENREAFNRWLKNHKSYNRSQKRNMARLRDDIENNVGNIERIVYPFVKREFYLNRKPPRMIAAVNAFVKVWTGAAWDELNHLVFENTQNFIKTVPIAERPRYIRDKLARFEHVAVADASRFESIVRRSLMKIEQHLYEMFGLDPDCYSGLAGVNMLQFTGGIANILAKRMSGEQNTSLGNSMLNLLLLSFVLVESGLSHDDFYVICEGDDAIIGYNGDINLDLFHTLGIKMQWDEVDHVGTGGFCGLYFGDALTPMVAPWELARMAWSLTAHAKMSQELLDELQWAKLKSLSHEAPGCPIAWMFGSGQRRKMRWKRNWWNVHLLNTQGIDVGGEEHWIEQESTIDTVEPTMLQRLDYSACFGVDVSTQLRVEKAVGKGDLRPLEDLIYQLQPQMAAASHYLRV